MSRIRLPIDWRSWSRSPRERPVPPRLPLLGYDECRILGPLQESWMSFAILVRATACLYVSHWVGSLAHLSHNSDRGCLCRTTSVRLKVEQNQLVAGIAQVVFEVRRLKCP